VTIRRPTEADAPAVADLIAALETHFLGRPEMNAPDLLDEWRELDLAQDAWLVEVDGRPAGYAALYTKRHTFVDAYVHPDAFGRGIGSQLVELSEQEARRRGITLLRNGVMGKDERAHALLEARGYRIVRRFYRMEIELDAPPPPPVWPEGLTPSPYEPREARAFHAALEEAFADHWGHRPESFEDWRRRMLEAPDVNTTVWWAVKQGDEIAAAAICDVERYGAGWVALMGVRKQWRRRGLGLALLRHCFGELYARGQRVVGLGVDAENPTGATRLYERAGMHEIFDSVVYEKQLGL
jgi:mycothiol synthase